MQDQHRTMTVTAEMVEEFRALATTWSGGANMFQIPCYPIDHDPEEAPEPSHYISTGPISASIAQYLPLYDYDAETGERVTLSEGDLPALVDAVNSANPATGLTLAMAERLLQHIDISKQGGFVALARMGLRLA